MFDIQHLNRAPKMLPIFFLLYCAIVDHSLAEFDPTMHENWHLLKTRNCESKPTSRIVEGTNAKIGEFPWIAGLVYMKLNEKQSHYLCSATILNAQTIITTATCVAEFSDELKYLAYVVFGDLDRRLDPDCGDKICAPPLQYRFLREIIYHKEYDSITHWNDIALLRTEGSILFNSYVWPICMLQGDLITSNFTGDEAVVAGWGATDKTAIITSEILMKVTLRVQDPNVCKSLSESKFDPEIQLCVGGEKYGPGPCFGDGGGPLMMVRDLKTFLIGIFTHNGINGEEECGNHENPPAFLRISAYLDWILDNLVESKRKYAHIAVYKCSGLKCIQS